MHRIDVPTLSDRRLMFQADACCAVPSKMHEWFEHDSSQRVEYLFPPECVVATRTEPHVAAVAIRNKTRMVQAAGNHATGTPACAPLTRDSVATIQRTSSPRRDLCRAA